MIYQKAKKRLIFCFMGCVLTVLSGVLLTAGCKNSKTKDAENQVAAVDESAEKTSKESEDAESDDAETKNSMMDHANHLLKQAKDVGSKTANSTSQWAQGVYQKSVESAGATTKMMNDSLQGLYKKAVESGSTTATSTKAWVEEDISKMGAWVYTSRTVSTKEDPLATVAMLNEMGREKWECFWVEKQGTATTLYFKKSPRSYISSIPFKDLVKMFPGLGSEN